MTTHKTVAVQAPFGPLSVDFYDDDGNRAIWLTEPDTGVCVGVGRNDDGQPFVLINTEDAIDAQYDEVEPVLCVLLNDATLYDVETTGPRDESCYHLAVTDPETESDRLLRECLHLLSSPRAQQYDDMTELAGKIAPRLARLDSDDEDDEEPEYAPGVVPRRIPRPRRSARQRLRRPRGKVIEYHHEQMTETASDYVVEELPSRTGFAIRNISTGELIMDGVMPLLRHTREAAEVEAEYLMRLHA